MIKNLTTVMDVYDPISSDWARNRVNEGYDFLGQSIRTTSDEPSFEGFLSLLKRLFPLDTFRYAGYDDKNMIWNNRMFITVEGYFGKNVSMNFLGSVKDADLISSQYKSSKSERIPSVNWYYTDERKSWNNFQTTLTPNKVEVVDEMYPYIPGGVNDFITNFFDSTSNILMLVGPPGTGKTSFIRHLIMRSKKDCMLTYDEDIMMSDQFYISYMTSSYGSLIIEDADVLLKSRKNSANKIMSKFLNVSDGLLSLERKKMVFTTNLDNLKEVDSALLRPGRCFATVNFRSLTTREADNLSSKIGLNVNASRSMTLSEIFNKQKNNID